MKKNAGIKVLTGVIVGVVGLVLINMHQTPEQIIDNGRDPNNLNQAIASQFNDNIRDVSARLIDIEKKMHAVEAENKALVLQNAQNKEARTGGFESAPSETSPEVLASINALKAELEQLKKPHTEVAETDSSYPLGEVVNSKVKPIKKASVKDIDALLLKRQLSEGEASYWTRLKKKNQGIGHKVKKSANHLTEKDIKRKDIPYYTIPAGADLGHTTLLSALIGEVPSEGKLMQPLFPFTAIISRGDLMASNGVPLPPDVSGMKVNGYAIGVGSFLDNISCVRAYVTSVLFTFQDGHFVVVGQEQMKNTTDMVNNESLGYLTTSYGNPCIHGKYFTNAPRVLGAMMAAGGVQGVGNALSQWQMSYFAGPNGGAALPTGSFGKFAAGGALADGSTKAADWLEKRIQGSFDMVFVPASSPRQVGNRTIYVPNHVSLHLTQTIAIDKQPNGRVLDYGRLQTYTRDFSLR